MGAVAFIILEKENISHMFALIGSTCYPTYPGTSVLFSQRQNALIGEQPTAASCINACLEMRGSTHPYMNTVSYQVNSKGCHCYDVTFQMEYEPNFVSFFLHCKLL